jgi:dCMP deaminase
MYIGLTGYMGSGKGEIVKFLQSKGFKQISLSDIVRREAKNQNLDETRENLQFIGNSLRTMHGAGVLGRKVKEEVEKQKDKNWVIDSIRNPKEIFELRKLPDFHMAGITAKEEVLIDRVLARNRTEGMNSKEEIIDKLNKEKGINEPQDGQQVKKCLEIADFLIVNEGTVYDMFKKIDHFIGLINGTERPTFDETFMAIAYSWAKRSTCLRRKVGSVIAKDRQQLTAGYNGAPKGLKHCAELGGCLREKLKIPSGQRHEICRGTHAEQNAITQAAKFGINIDGGTLYVNTHPCVICAKMIINAGIQRVVFDADYNDPLSKELLASQTVLKVERYEGLKYILN